MAINRYARSNGIRGGQALGTGRAGQAIYWAVQNGSIPVAKRLVKDGERLDTIAGKMYGDAGMWWVIAAASGIGWGMQVPPGIVLSIPTDLNTVNLFVG